MKVILYIFILFLLCLKLKNIEAIFEEQAGEFDWLKENIGNIVQVKITGSNQNSLFGILKENYNKRVA